VAIPSVRKGNDALGRDAILDGEQHLQRAGADNDVTAFRQSVGVEDDLSPNFHPAMDRVAG
jgi:hypothetical protein